MEEALGPATAVVPPGESRENVAMNAFVGSPQTGSACRRRASSALAGITLAGLLSGGLAGPAAAQGPRWTPLGPNLIVESQAWGARVPATGRINVVAANPYNPFGDVWVGSAGGGVWNGAVYPSIHWQPMTDLLGSLAVGSLALDSCDKSRCETVWVGTGENGIRRDTQYGRGLYRGTYASGDGVYNWFKVGGDLFDHGSITRVVLDPSTADGKGKRLYLAVSSGQTSNSTHSTVTTLPTGGFGIYRSLNGGDSFEKVLDAEAPATDLEIDPLSPRTVYAAFQGKGIWRSGDGGSTWEQIVNGIPASKYTDADWPEIALFHSPLMLKAVLYAVLGGCPHPHLKSPGVPTYCSPVVYRSDNDGADWLEVYSGISPPPPKGTPLTSYTPYTHALTLHPTDPNTLWYGGINLYKSTNGGVSWTTVGASRLHPNHHQVQLFPTDLSPTGIAGYDVSDGGLYLGDGENEWNGEAQNGLGVALMQSLDRSPLLDLLLGGALSNGTNLHLGVDVWQHADDGGTASATLDRNDSEYLYDAAVGGPARRCSGPGYCLHSWSSSGSGFNEGVNISWFPPLVQSRALGAGEYPLFIAGRTAYRSLDDAATWVPITPTSPLGGNQTYPELANIINPVTAIAISPTNPNRVYLGYYGGQVFTTANALSSLPVWLSASSGLPNRPVTALAVSPGDEQLVLATFAGPSTHSVYRSDNAGTSWASFDDSWDGELAPDSANALAFEGNEPYAVWVGTDTGAYRRDSAGAVAAPWTRSLGLPRAAVYAFRWSDDNARLYAATHGRGVWMYGALPTAEAYQEDCCSNGSLYTPQPSISLVAAGFDPNLPFCSLTLVQGTTACAAASYLDGDGAVLSTDSEGYLVASRPPAYEKRRMSWACTGGACAGGLTTSGCAMSSIIVQCGDRTVRTSVHVAQNASNPVSTVFSLGNHPTRGAFSLVPMLKRRDGLSSDLCGVYVAYLPNESELSVLNRAASAVNASTICGRAGVTAQVIGGSPAGVSEDGIPSPYRLKLSAPSQNGVQLVTKVIFSGAVGMGVTGYGNRKTGSEVVPRLTFGGLAQGGDLTFTIISPLGQDTCVIHTDPGDSAIDIISKIEIGMNGRDLGGGLPIGGGGPSPPRPRGLLTSNERVDFPYTHGLIFDCTDPGLTVTLASGR